MIKHRPFIHSIWLTSTLMILLISCNKENKSPRFEANRVTRTCELKLTAPVSEVFQLFDPEHEKKWAYDWEYELVYPESGSAENNIVFKTKHVGESEAIWTIIDYSIENHEIVYLAVTPGNRVTRIQIRCEDDGDETTSAQVTYILTALTVKGNAYVQTFTEEYYIQWMDHWEKAINYYLETGDTLRKHGH